MMVTKEGRSGLEIVSIYSAGHDSPLITAALALAVRPCTLAIANSEAPNYQGIECYDYTSNYGLEIDICTRGTGVRSLGLDGDEQPLQRHFASSLSQFCKDARPETGGTPEPVPLVGRLPRAVFRWHRPPRGAGAYHPQDAGEDGPVVVARPPGRWLLGREQRLDQAPLGVGQLCLGWCRQRSRAGGW